jgi:hypothetical protein
MRLEILDNGHRPIQKLLLRVAKLAFGEVPGPIAVMSYRSEMFGKGLSKCFQQAMREQTQWSDGETELFAAFVSKQNSCAY